MLFSLGNNSKAKLAKIGKTKYKHNLAFVKRKNCPEKQFNT